MMVWDFLHPMPMIIAKWKSSSSKSMVHLVPVVSFPLRFSVNRFLSITPMLHYHGRKLS